MEPAATASPKHGESTRRRRSRQCTGRPRGGDPGGRLTLATDTSQTITGQKKQSENGVLAYHAWLLPHILIFYKANRSLKA